MSEYFKPLPEKYPNLYYNKDIPNAFIIPKGYCRNVVWYKKDENGKDIAIVGTASSDKKRPLGPIDDSESLDEKWTFMMLQGFEDPEQLISLISILTKAAMKLYELQSKEAKEDEV